MSSNLEEALQNLVTRIARHNSVRAIGLSSGERPLPEPGEGDIDLFVYCTEIPSRLERREMLMSLREATHVEIGKLEGGQGNIFPAASAQRSICEVSASNLRNAKSDCVRLLL
jgi:hypothetical protein